MRQNRLNDLDAKGWLKFTKTWFVFNPTPRRKTEILHPAKFPEGVVREFILFFTKKGEKVLDPFVGTGSTLVACDETERMGVGVELQEKYASLARNRTKQRVIVGNSVNIRRLVRGKVDFIITSPPYGPMLNKKGLVQQARKEKKLDTRYSSHKDDLGNISDYSTFVKTIASVFLECKAILKPDKYMVVIVQNYRNGKVYQTLAWDIARELSGHFTLVGERLWLQDNKTLYPYGMGYGYVPNVHHHYCLIFKNM